MNHEEAADVLLGAGSPFELTTEKVGGREVKVFKTRERSMREKVAAASEAEGAMRAQRDQLRHTQVSAEIRLMSLQKELNELERSIAGAYSLDFHQSQEMNFAETAALADGSSRCSAQAKGEARCRAGAA